MKNKEMINRPIETFGPLNFWPKIKATPFEILGSFSSKTRTSLKTQLLFPILEHSNFPTLSLPESCSQTNKFPKNSSHSRISILFECAHFVFCFPSRCPILCSAAFKSILFRLSVSE